MSFKTLSIALAAIGALAAFPAMADSKIGVVHFGDLVQNSPQAKAAGQKMQTEFQKRKDDLDAQVKQFQDDAAKFQRDGGTMPKDQSEKLARDLNTRQSDLKFQGDKFDRDLQTRNQEMQKSVVDAVVAAISSVAKDKGLDVVLPDYIYAGPGLDISDDVMKRLSQAAAAPASK